MKKMNLIIFVICCILQVVQASDIVDQDSKTELMNYVIEQEKKISAKRSELYRFYNKYFIMNQETGIIEKVIWATDENLIHYRSIDDEYDNLVAETIEHINMMVLQGADLQARDIHGKSIRDYCITDAIHQVLKKMDAPITLKEYYFRAYVLGAVTVPVVMFIAALTYRIYYPPYYS